MLYIYPEENRIGYLSRIVTVHSNPESAKKYKIRDTDIIKLPIMWYTYTKLQNKRCSLRILQSTIPKEKKQDFQEVENAIYFCCGDSKKVEYF